ncbi:MAG: serine/threonine protein kinase, partial [Sulfuricella denitrificans]|nr:serine/threonine protein kinase [Sulfuricella denitrificans]
PNPPGTLRCLYCNRSLQKSAPAGDIHLPTLPAALRDDYRVIEEFPASGSEADLMLVESRKTGERQVAKLYRKGIRPDSELLARLSRNPAGHVVRLVAHGLSGGNAYELMEYCPYGTLRELFDSGPQPRERLHEMVKEMAAGLSEIHAQRILHRDLKPDNFLVRGRDPLQLALSDFGIASLQQATQHFTTLARSVRYAAPEALTGVLDEKADWWSLGMIVLEAATGRHPFEGLSDQVINHHLATRPIDVRSVFDDNLRKLCRGLLLRDPKRRWSEPEVARWLANDPTLPMPEESEAAAATVRPYRIGEASCTSALELATALAKNWSDGSKDLKRGEIGNWLTQQLNDHNLARRLQDILDERGVSDDYRLLRFLLAAAPDMPAAWRGESLNEAALLAAARRAIADDRDAQAWLESIAAEPVLAACEKAGHAALGAFGQRWHDGWERFCMQWEAAHQAEEEWRTTPRTMDGNDESAYVNIDDVMYSRPLRLAQPSRRSLNARLLLLLHDAEFAALTRTEVLAGRGELEQYCPWYQVVGDIATLGPAELLAARQLLPLARDDAEREMRRLGSYSGNRGKNIESLREDILKRLQPILQAGRSTPLDALSRQELDSALTAFNETSRKALQYGYPEEDYRKLCLVVEQLVERALAVEQALGELEYEEDINFMYLQPNRIGIAFAILLVIFGAIGPWTALAGTTALAGLAVYRIRAKKQAEHKIQNTLQALGRLRSVLSRPEP